MFWTPVSGSRVMTLVAVSVGAESKPGVETGIGSISRPRPSPLSASPSITTSWQTASFTSRGSIGLAIALSHLVWMSSSLASMPML